MITMASLIPGFEYDIFISYRQKDNKHDGWVTEFVENLKGELESTFKEEISVYFDINPHDGLLETHDVDASLKDKLKCLIFIPIISRTYCDQKSFAWEHEFKAFVKQASQDQFGLKVKLPNGNVASRVLPVRIHDLDNDDMKLFEGVTGSVMRTLDFVFKTTSGVNRPLKAKEDHPNDNLNKTYYQDQINKISLAIKELISALRQFGQKHEELPKEVIKPISLPQKSHKTKIIVGSVIFLSLIIIGYFLIPKQSKPKEQVDKSIAVLPFKSLSNDPDKQYLADGIMDAILLHLSKIKDLRVMSRTSVEQYRKTDKTLNVIGTQLNVAYLLEGSFQKFGDNARLIVQLIKTGKEGHVWANDYDRNWSDIFKVQSEVAQKIADELNAAITPDEKQLINKIPTTNLTAYDFYQNGEEEMNKYWIDRNNRQALIKAEELYRQSLKYDSTFARAYVGLAMVYRETSNKKSYFSENYLDSVLVFTNKALSIDGQISGAYYEKGMYYELKGLYDKALEEFDKALVYNPNDCEVYAEKAHIYMQTSSDFVKSIDNMHKAIARLKGSELPGYLDGLAGAYCQIGFYDKAKYYYQEALNLSRDSAAFLLGLASIANGNENFEEALRLAKEAYELDTTNFIGQECYYYLPSSYNQEAFLNFKKLIKSSSDTIYLNLWYSYRFALLLWKMSKHKEADYYFKQQIKYDEESIKLGRWKSGWGASYYDLAAVYSFLGEKEKAYNYLDKWNIRKVLPLWWLVLFRHDQYFDSIRGEARFQKIMQDVEAKYQAEHERVRKWLEENKML